MNIEQRKNAYNKIRDIIIDIASYLEGCYKYGINNEFIIYSAALDVEKQFQPKPSCSLDRTLGMSGQLDLYKYLETLSDYRLKSLLDRLLKVKKYTDKARLLGYNEFAWECKYSNNNIDIILFRASNSVYIPELLNFIKVDLYDLLHTLEMKANLSEITLDFRNVKSILYKGRSIQSVIDSFNYRFRQSTIRLNGKTFKILEDKIIDNEFAFGDLEPLSIIIKSHASEIYERNRDVSLMNKTNEIYNILSNQRNWQHITLNTEDTKRVIGVIKLLQSKY